VVSLGHSFSSDSPFFALGGCCVSVLLKVPPAVGVGDS
jgi:hypothetical protein